MKRKGVVKGWKKERNNLVGGKGKKNLQETRVHPVPQICTPLLRVVVHVLKLIYQVVFRYFYVCIYSWLKTFLASS